MENLIKETFILFEQIGGTTSKTAKEEYLRQGASNQVFKTLLFQCYNPYVLFYVKKDPEVEPQGGFSLSENYANFMGLLELLTSRKITGNAALEQTARVLSDLTPTEYKWYLKVLQKDLKIGITEKTINGVFGKNFIPTFECMLAEKIKKYPKQYAYNRKYDGYRFCAFHYEDDRGVMPVSRNGHPITGYNGVEASIAELPPGFMYDGEIMDRDGTFAGTQKSAFKKVEGKDGVFHIFDMVPIEEFASGVGSTPYRKRLEMLEMVRWQIEASPYLSWVPYEILTNSKEDIELVDKLHDEYVQAGFEGGMIKDLDAVYKNGKGYAIQKVKKFFDIDLIVVDVEEGKKGTQFEGTLGALVVELSDKDIIKQLPKGMPYIEGGIFRVNVGSGFKVLPHHEFNRDVLWARKEDLINRTIEIRCFGSSINDDGGHSLRFPIFKRIRNDK